MLFGWRFISERELQLRKEITDTKISSLSAELAAAKEYIRKCEALIDKERTRIDSERERADRIADSLFQSNGLPATSTTVIQEQKTAEANGAEKRADYLKELMEIYGEQMDEMTGDGAEPLPEALAEVKVQ